MVEISSGSFGPPQSSVTPGSAITPPGLNDNDEDERAVRKSAESDTRGGDSQTDVRERESAEADRADDTSSAAKARADDSGNQVDINV